MMTLAGTEVNTATRNLDAHGGRDLKFGKTEDCFRAFLGLAYLTMGDGGLTISLGDSLPYLEQRFLKLFGQDAESKELAEWFRGLQTTALIQTASVQCLGMRDPVPFPKIYQPTRLIVGPDPDNAAAEESFSFQNRVSRSIMRGRSFSEKIISVDEFLWRDQDAIIRSGPGWGKTTVTHYIYRSTLHNENLLPVLITLRRPTAVADLEKYVSACSRIQKNQQRACTILLVDGYDEVSTEDQRRVSEALLSYQGQGAGKFYLTCRDYYEVAQLNAPEVRIDVFSRDDQIRFVDVFLTAFGCPHDPVAVVEELEQRGFDEFLEHPLLLTLACIVKTSPMTAQPRSGLRLLQKALSVLCYQWDEQKKISRQPSTPLEGEDRIRILMNIAYRSASPFVKQARAEETARKQLALMRFDRIDARQVLMEIARFYGILVPSEDGYDFVHRTIHDYLAAKHWVESGDFARAASYPWNARTGYAACLMSDATAVLQKALDSPAGLPTAAEIISNAASFDMETIAGALLKYFSGKGHVLEHRRVSTASVPGKPEPDLNRIVGQLDSDFVRWADSRFLDFIVEHCCETNTPVNNLLVAYAMTELYHRRAKLSMQTYQKALAAYKTDKFTFVVPGAKQAQLEFLNPELQNRMKDFKVPAKESQG